MTRKNNFIALYKLLFVTLLLFVAGCNSEHTPPENLSTENTLISFSFKKEKNPSLFLDISGEIIGDSVFLYTLMGTDITALIPEFAYSGELLTVNGTRQQSGINKQDFSKHVTYQIKAENGDLQSYHVKVSDTGLPTVHISTDGVPIVSKEDYVDGRITITTGLLGDILYEADTEIRGRGNSTWGMPKKPYRIKLENKAELLGMPADKSWALIANYGDQSLLRNDIAFELSRRLELAYTPRQQHVELFLNGKYQGNYTLTEHIKESKDRIAIDEDNGGFVLEQDGYAYQEPVYFTTPRDVPITIKFPDDDDITANQFDYIRNHYTTFENRLFSEHFSDLTDGYQPYFDLPSFVNYYLVNEICGNTDMVWSMRMFKKNDDDPKIYTGPVWDFDLAFNNDKRIGQAEAINKLMLTNAHAPRQWMDRIAQDPVFKKMVRERWNATKETQIKTITAYLDKQAKRLAYSQSFNFERWDILGQNINQSWYVGTTHADYVDFVRNYLTERIIWLDKVFNGSQFD